MAVECGPGYPMSLRMFNPADDRLLSGSPPVDPASPDAPALTLGYPVVDGPDRAGHFCDRCRDGEGFGPEAIKVMCK